jgi:hypothetical protein
MKIITNDFDRALRLKKFLAEEVIKCSPQEIVDTIESFLGSFETISDEERQFIFNIWGNLEEIHALSLSRDRDKLSEEDQKDFGELLQKLSIFVEELIQKMPIPEENEEDWWAYK